MMSDNTYRELGNRVLTAMANDPALKNLPEGTLNYWKRYIRYSPVVLSQRLRSKVSLAELYAARVDWIEYLLRKNIFPKVYGAFSHLQKDRINAGQRRDEVIFSLALEDPDAAVDRAIEHGTAYRERNNTIPPGMTEKGLLMILGLTGQALEEFVAGKLTVERLLILEPWMILTI
jgi:hypothetical protein